MTLLVHAPLALALLACFLPWLQGPGAALTLNAWDLAEWSSLNPLSQVALPALGASFGLRALPLFLLALALCRPRVPLPLRAALTLLLAIALLPPLEFFRSDLADPNYRQQLALAFIALLTGLASGLHLARLPLTAALLSAAALLTASLALSAALALHRSLGLDAAPGIGPFLFASLMLGNLLRFFLTRKRRPRGAARPAESTATR